MVKVGIIGAMEVEVSYLKSIMQNARASEKASLHFFEGVIQGVNVVVVQSGIGKVNAAMCATILCGQFGVTHLINTGVAGGLQDGLAIFDTVVSTDAMYHDFDTTEFGYAPCTVPGMKTSIFEADKTLIDFATRAFAKTEFASQKKIVTGRVASGDVFVNSSELKSSIKKLCNPSCVEMEGAAVAHVCYLHAVPFVVIRCISDMAENTDEVYQEEKAAKISSQIVEAMLQLF